METRFVDSMDNGLVHSIDNRLFNCIEYLFAIITYLLVSSFDVANVRSKRVAFLSELRTPKHTKNPIFHV